MNGFDCLREKIKMFRQVPHVLYISSTLVNSRRCQDENGKKMYQNAKRTCGACRAFVFVH